MRKFTTEDLKPGMFVELKNGKTGILLPCYDTYGHGEVELTVVNSTPTRLCVARLYSDKYTCDYAIIKVYDLNEGNDKSIFSDGNRDLIWAYNEPKELTIKEIEKLLGYPVKIVE